MDSRLPPEAYGRVTDPERFRPLWAVGEELLDRLARDYRVVAVDRTDLDRKLVASVTGGAQRVVRVTPATGGGAPLVVAFTGFPGLRVRFGRWHIEGFPVCGCDACDEQPDELAQELSERVDALVAGEFSESLSVLRRPGISYSFGRDGGWSSTSRLEAVRLGGPKTIAWAAWPRADESSVSR